MTKKRDRRPHKAKRVRRFYHNAQPSVMRLLGRRRHETGWLMEYRARRADWVQEVRERMARESA